MNRLYTITIGAVAVLALLAHHDLYGATPQQAQASALAVPGEAAQKPYASALVVVQCKQAVAVVLIDHDGMQRPLNLKGLTPAMLMTQLSQVPADSVTQIEVTCSSSTSI